MIPPPQCPPEELLAAFVEGSVSVSEREQVESHLAECAICQSMIALVIRKLDSGAAPLDLGVCRCCWGFLCAELCCANSFARDVYDFAKANPNLFSITTSPNNVSSFRCRVGGAHAPSVIAYARR